MNRKFFYSLLIILLLLPIEVRKTLAVNSRNPEATMTNQVSATVNPSWIERIPASTPPANILHAMAYDSARAITVMFGGLDYASGPRNETWELTAGTQWVKRTPLHKPTARYGHALAYDIARGETIMFGGAATATQNETWVWNGNDWVQKFPATNPPGLFGPVMTYDTQRGVIVLFGGENQTGIHNETWEWNGTNWAQKMTVTSPPPRNHASMTYDTDRNKIILFGGLAGDSKFNDIWEYDGNNWVDRTLPGGPSARGGTGLAYDSTTHRVVLFGGVSTHEFNETWNWDGVSGIWTQRSTPSSPDARSTVMVYDSTRSVSVVFGGGSGANGTKIFKDTWEWNDTTGIWKDTLPELSPPAAASTHMVYDSLHGEFVLFGGTVGCCGAVVHGETWTWNGTDSQWVKRLPTNSPSPRSGQMMAYDSHRGITVLFGGRLLSNTLSNDTWEWDGTNWTQSTPTTVPNSREETTMAYDVDRGVSVLFGGRNNGTLYSDTWEWDGTNWTQRFPLHNPTARVGTRLVYDKLRHVTVLFGGADTTGTVLNDTWEWDGNDWIQQNPVVSPQPVAATGMAYDIARGVTVMFGGQDPSTPYWDITWEWDGTNWTPITIPTHPPARGSHAMAYDSKRNKVVIFGGNWPFGVLDDTWEYQGPAASNSPPTLTTDNASPVVDEGQIASNTGTYADANANDNVMLSASIGTVNKTGTSSGSWSWSYVTTDGPAQSQMVIITANDGQGGVSTSSFSLTVNNAKPTVTAPSVSPEPSKENSSITVNATFSDPGINDAPFTCTINYGDASGNSAGTVNGNTCAGPMHTYTKYGSYRVTVSVTDKDNGTGANVITHAVIYPFTGFFQPVDNLPVLNVVKAGSAIQVKFSLGGNQDLTILAAGYPASQNITCDTSAPLADIEQTVTAGSSSLTYDAVSGQYSYVWKTDKAWTGTCRQLVVRLADGTDHKATFKFK